MMTDMVDKVADLKCYELAVHFLGDEPHLNEPDRLEQLTLLIQQTIEDFITHENDNYEPKETGDAWSGGFAENH